MKNHKKHHGSKLAAGALVAGAAIGAAAAVVLSDKKNRDQLVKSAGALKDEALKHVQKLDKDTKPLQKKAGEALKDGKKAIEKKI